MDAKTNQSEEVQGLQLIRAFLTLSPEKRAEVIAFVEKLARAHRQPEGGTEVLPR